MAVYESDLLPSAPLTFNSSNLQEFSHGATFQRLLAQLAKQLPRLTTREAVDPTIALLDAWAMVIDVLSFYQQNYNQECYLKTAKELISICQLAKNADYHLSPGLAASTWLAFSVEEKANNTGVANIPAGTKVQSMPTNDGLPQTFETSMDLQARSEFNVLRPYQSTQTQIQEINYKTRQLKIVGMTANLNPGDRMLLTGKVQDRQTKIIIDKIVAYSFIITSSNIDSDEGLTEINWQGEWADKDLSGNNIPLTETDDKNPPSKILVEAQLFVFRKSVNCFGHNAPLVSSLPAGSYYRQGNDWDGLNQNNNSKSVVPQVWQNSQDEPNDSSALVIHLDQELSQIISQDWLLLSNELLMLCKVATVSSRSIADFGLTGHVTRVELLTAQGGKPPAKLPEFPFRTTNIFAEAEQLPLWSEVIPVLEILKFKGDNQGQGGIVLENLVPTINKGQQLIISQSGSFSEKVTITAINSDAQANTIIIDLSRPLQGSYQNNTTTIKAVGMKDEVPVEIVVNSDNKVSLIIHSKENPIPAHTSFLQLNGILNSQSEMITVQNYDNSKDGRTRLYLMEDLKESYSVATAVLYGNVVMATHGETVTEVLGSGDGSQANQSFTLQQTPLTYLSAATPSGIKSTLQIRVNDILWQEAPSLYSLTPTSQCYVVSEDENGRVSVIFGDGQRGARLPSGVENVQATYRCGIGPLGEIAANNLMLLQTRPQGVSAVNNPLPAVGSAPRESLEEARINIPFNVLSLDRIVSLRDFEDFIRAYAGISKVKADSLMLDHLFLLYITIAGTQDSILDEQSALYNNLLQAIASLRNAGRSIIIKSYEPRYFQISAKLTVAKNRDPDLICQQVKTALANTFSFSNRQLAQDVTAAEVIQIIQNGDGVLGVNLEKLDFDDVIEVAKNNRLISSPALVKVVDGKQNLQSAQLLMISRNPKFVTIEV